MKKNLFMVAAVALLAAVSCIREQVTEHLSACEVVTFEASVDGADTKTVLDGKVSKWSGQEWIQIVGSKAYWFGSEKMDTPSDRAIFSYNGANGEFVESGAIMAVYPAGNKPYTLGDEAVSGVSIKTSQNAIEGSYDKDAALMVAYADAKDGSLQYKNVHALLKFTMGSENIGKVTFWGTLADGSTALVSGSGSVLYNAGNPVFTPLAIKDGGAAYVELLNDAKFKKDAVYYIAVAPGKFKSVTVEFDGISAKSKTFDTPYEIRRNTILDLGTLESQSTGRVIVGSTAALGNWNAGSGVQFVEGTNYYEAKNVTLTGSEEFKLVIDGKWFSSSSTAKTGVWLSLVDGANMKLAANTYDFYLTKDAEARLYIAVAGSSEPTAPGVVAAKDGYLYLKPNTNWKKDGARFAAYFFGNGETWVSMTDPDGDGIFEVQIPTSKKYPSVIFCRMNPSASANNWSNKWNQSADLTVPTNGNNLYTVKEGTWDKGGGSWSTVKEFK